MKHQDNIQKYLKGKMQPNERAVFEQKMAENKKLAEDVNFQKDLGTFFEQRKPDLESKLTQLGEEFFDTRPVFWRKPSTIIGLFSSIFFGIGVVFYLLTKTPKVLPLNENKTSTEQKATITPAVPRTEESKPKAEKVEAEVIPEATNIKEKEQKTPSKPIVSDKPKRIIAALNPEDFTINPLLENLIGEQVRSYEWETSILSPAIGEEIPYQEKTLFKLKGKSKAEPPYLLKIYSNKIVDFGTDKSILQIELAGTKNTSEYDISWQANIPLHKGLYYIMLQQKDSEELLKMSKFLVK